MFKKEDFAVVLDFLPHGKAGEAKQEPVVQCVGELFFTLLECVAKPGIAIDVDEKIYIGREQREKIDHIRGRIAYADLTTSAQRQLDSVVRSVVQAREKEFVEFVNRAGPINIRSHALEHLPSVGKKHLQNILDERERQKFESFEDIHKRVAHLGNPLEIFVQRIMLEIQGKEKYYLFVKMPRDDRRW
ncbi:DUF655 domain-containing protein [Candidatus Micrarchaeota archaeon]|nr:DUF655 domain-containing protein [Candidatus Micrarchaeota archaeon]